MASVCTVQFGDLLRQFRLAAGLTQEALAERAGLSVHGVQKLERGVTRPYRDTLQRLLAGLRLDDDDAARFVAAGAPAPRQRSAQPLWKGSAPRWTDLPLEPTSFVGRERELLRLAEQLRSARLLTLIGPGGVGKTRLATRLALRLMDRFRDGACVVGLANVTESRGVAYAVAAALGVTERGRTPLHASLLEALRESVVLLMMDNCEHVLDGCAELAHDILRTCPRVTLLATSREPLRLSGEVTWPVPPLSVDRSEAPDGATSESEQLFIERARTVDPRFEVLQENRAAIGRICQQLDGLPLAIELAAARVRSMPVRRLAQDLQAARGALPLLTGGPRDAPLRQQTLRATIAWSYELLSADEQALFRRLAPFRGCTLDAVEAVCATPAQGSGATTLALTPLRFDVRDGLDSLVNKSLVHVEEDERGQPWYTMLETVREFALDALVRTGESTAVCRRHTWYYLRLASESAPAPGAVRQDYFMRRLDREIGNFRAALDWCQTHGYAEASLRLAVALVWFWGVRGRITEGRSRFEMLLSHFPLRTRTGQRAVVHAQALHAVAELATLQRDFSAALAYGQQSLALSEAINDQPAVCDALYGLAFTAQQQGDTKAARGHLERGVAIARDLAESEQHLESTTTWRVAQGLVGLGVLVHEEGDERAAIVFIEESTEFFLRSGHRMPAAMNDVELGAIAHETGDDDRARKHIVRGLKTLEEVGDRRGTDHLRRSLRMNQEIAETGAIAFVLVRFAHLAAARDQAASALRLSGAAAALREQGEIALAPAVHRRLDEQIAPARRTLGPRAEAVFAAGRALSAEAAIAEALALEPPTNTNNDLLSAREREVAGWIALGYSNRQVAHELVISEATVATHVQHILAKLELASRAQIAVWADRRQLQAHVQTEERS
jgi:non-specific serine/threonine protein kinase